MLKVLHWYPNLLSSKGNDGVFHTVYRLSEAQSSLGAEVAIAAASIHAPHQFHLKKARLLEWDASWSTTLGSAYLRWLAQAPKCALREFNPDVVHAHGDFNFDNWWLPLIFKCPIVFSPHGAFHPQVFSKRLKTLKHTFLALGKPLFYRKIALFHACCPMEGEHIAQVLPEAHICSIPLGPSREMTFQPPDTTTNQDVTFVYLGRLDVHTKGLDILLEAFALVAKGLHAKCRLALIGPDQQGGRQKLERKAQELGVCHLVHFTGPLSGPILDETLSRADIYVQLSRHEGYSLSSVEALRAGLPTVLSSAMGVVSLPEVQTLPHVHIVPPCSEEAAKAMLDLAHHLGHAKEEANRSQARLASLFSWERISQSFLTHYQEVVDQRHPNARSMMATER